MVAINIQQLIDERPISRVQRQVFLFCALVILLDGIDYQLMGLLAPAVAADLGISPARLGWVFGSGPFGAFFGGLLCGPLADRFGRKALLIATTFLFGAATLATSLVDGLVPLVIARFITGVGLGGAVPSCVALVSEYAPARRRAAYVSLLWASFPLGGMTGGFVNAALLNYADWRSLFVIWGAAPMVVSLILFLLPESAQFLLVRGGQEQRARSIVERFAGPLPPDSTLVMEDRRVAGVSIGGLFRDGRSAGTIPLWIACFIVFGSLTVLSTWSPALLTQQGLTSSAAALVMGVHGLGSFIGSASAGRLMERFGVRAIVLPFIVLSGLSVVAYGHAADAAFAILLVASLSTGLTMGASSSSIVALAAVIYPTSVRSTGTGWGMAMGRAGSVVGPILAGFLVAAGAGVTGLFTALALMLMIALPVLWLLDAYRRTQRDVAPAIAPALDAAEPPLTSAHAR